jgi:hypothetical protein
MEGLAAAIRSIHGKDIESGAWTAFAPGEKQPSQTAAATTSGVAAATISRIESMTRSGSSR